MLTAYENLAATAAPRCEGERLHSFDISPWMISDPSQALASTYAYGGTETQALALSLSILGNNNLGVAPTTLAGAGIITQPQNVNYPASLWSWCAASGYDPFVVWRRNNGEKFFAGPGTGAESFPPRCGTQWKICGNPATGCSTFSTWHYFYPAFGLAPLNCQ